MVLADEVLEYVSGRQESPPSGFHGWSELRGLPNTFEGSPELTEHRLVGFVADP
jgi:hypothetical protein